MRSPSGARFPSRLTALLLVVLLGACTGGDDAPAPETPTPAVATPQATSPAGARGGSEAENSSLGGDGSKVVVADRDSKRTVRGEAPPYVEIESAEVSGAVDELRLGVTLAGGVPQKMPDGESVLRVSFMLTMKDGRKFTFDAQCVKPGWGTFAAGGAEDAPIPELAIEGKRLALVVDPTYIGGIQPFEWIVSVAWTSGTANYAFDNAPKRGLASFP